MKFSVTPKILKNLFIAIIFLLCFTYLGVEAQEIFNPPNLEIFEPNNNFTTNEKSITIKGSSCKEAKIYINDKGILAESNGDFTETIGLQMGVNIIKIEASKKYSQTNTVYRKVLVVESI
ncbi:hypothetical protein HOD96_00035 [Candidatus Falkowbacteria bacterium]|jgi:hypothetical protein|nr:hypothetical protein [Candidatus Falkowbacteria bacterium]MBT4432798.1 hypothetical protein [Candidatus Falkowbacteria bacterium]